jgi:membrane-associated phospholipid phosphatase
VSGAGRGDRNDGNTLTREPAADAGGDSIKPADHSYQASQRTGLLKAADKVIIAYIMIIAAMVVIFRHRIDLWWQLLIGHAAAIAVVFLIAKLGQRARSNSSPSVASLLRGWYPVALIPITYKELTYLIPLVHPRDYDVEMALIDRWLFGVDPTVWLEQITWPILTDVLQLSYTTYYFLPIALGAVLWRKRQFDRFHFFVFVVALGFYISYIGYISVPVIGPRFLPMIKDAQSFPLAGALFDGQLFRAVRDTLDRAEGITRDCFPSGHTELTLLVLYYSRRFHRRTFWLMLPVGSALIFSTVYLRYHYVIDVIAGAACAVGVIAVARPLYRALGGRLEVGGQGSGAGGQG